MATAETTTGKQVEDAIGTGRRKASVARVRIRPGSGMVKINRRALDDYFPLEHDRQNVLAPLEDTGFAGQVDVIIRVSGGGSTGQSGACCMGIARALVKYDEQSYQTLREAGHMTRDSRMKERKKPGLHGARRGTQFSKR